MIEQRDTRDWQIAGNGLPSSCHTGSYLQSLM